MNSKNKTYNRKHLIMTQRIWIEKGLNDNESFASIARRIEKDPTTVLKEVKRNRFFPKRSVVWKPLPCNRKNECQIRFLCDGMDCKNLCKSCVDICPNISKAPYVCNGCLKVKRYNLQHKNMSIVYFSKRQECSTLPLSIIRAVKNSPQ